MELCTITIDYEVLAGECPFVYNLKCDRKYCHSVEGTCKDCWKEAIINSIGDQIKIPGCLKIEKVV